MVGKASANTSATPVAGKSKPGLNTTAIARNIVDNITASTQQISSPDDPIVIPPHPPVPRIVQQSRARQAPQPSETTTFNVPAFIVNTARVEKTYPFLRPTMKDNNAPISGSHAVRANEKYQNFEALWQGERAYVRQYMRHAARIVLYSSPGKNPILILINCSAANLIHSVPGQRMSDLVQQRVESISPPREETVEVQLPQVAPLYRLVATTEQFASKFSQVRYTSARENFIPGLVAITASLTNEQGKEMQEAGITMMPVEDIISGPRPSHYATLRFKSNVAHEVAMKRAVKIAAAISGYAIYKTFNCVRIVASSPFNQELIRTIAPTKQEILLPDIALPVLPAEKRVPKGWKPVEEGPALQAGEAPPSQIHCRLNADFLPQEEEWKAVVQAIGATVVASASARYTDAVMALVVAFPRNQEGKDQVARLLKSKISGGNGRTFYLSDHQNIV